ncbi:MAG: protein-glutamate O-methyltransferase CheR [Bermanella sp.]
MNQFEFYSRANIESKEKIERALFLSAVKQAYGYDFSQYSESMLVRRLDVFKSKMNVKYLSELIPMILYRKELMDQLLFALSITVTEFFREPEFYSRFIEGVIPRLKTYPFISLWCAGCATGEEAFSWAILLEESNLLDKATIYATDINKEALSFASKGRYKVAALPQAKDNYSKMGGKYNFENYLKIDGDYFEMLDRLKNKITFSSHNLSHDRVFSEMQVISCRNVMIYFNKNLKDSCVSLFFESLTKSGYFCIGEKESIVRDDLSVDFIEVDRKFTIFKKISM